MKLYSTEEAAAYLGLEVETIRYHVYRSGHLSGTKVGNSLVFTQEELDAFKANKPKPGRVPRAKVKEA